MDFFCREHPSADGFSPRAVAFAIITFLRLEVVTDDEQQGRVEIMCLPLMSMHGLKMIVESGPTAIRRAVGSNAECAGQVLVRSSNAMSRAYVHHQSGGFISRLCLVHRMRTAHLRRRNVQESQSCHEAPDPVPAAGRGGSSATAMMILVYAASMAASPRDDGPPSTGCPAG